MRARVIQTEAVGIDEVVAQLRRNFDAYPSCAPAGALLFTSVDFDEREIVDELLGRWPDLPLAGLTVAAVCSSEHGLSEDGVQLVLFEGDDLTVESGRVPVIDLENDDTSAFLDRVAAWRDGLLFFFPAAGVVAEGLVEAMHARTPPGLLVVGGGSGRHALTREAPRQFDRDGSSQAGCSWLHLGGSLECAWEVCGGWRPVGPEMRVNRSEGATLQTLDGQPALDVYRRFFGEHSRPAFEFPLVVRTERQGRQVLRVPTSYDEGVGDVRFAARIPQGACVQLCESSPQTLLEACERGAEKLSARSDAPAFVLGISCNARRGLLGTQTEREWDEMATRLPGVPVAGFHAFAEYAPLSDGGDLHVHQMTMIQVAVGRRVEEMPTPVPAAEAASPSAELLARRLERSEAHRRSLETIKENHARLLRVLREELDAEKQRSEALLLNVLPEPIAEELKCTGHVEPVLIEDASVLFTDFVGFTAAAASMRPSDIVSRLGDCFTAFDAIVARHGLEKLKTIGDAYMCAGGLLDDSEDHTRRTVAAALEMRDWVEERARGPHGGWSVRIGVHCGPLVAGVIGTSKFAYDVWGDTVNVASRLESNGMAGKVNVSTDVLDALGGAYAVEPRGKVAVKNRGEIDMFFVEPRA